MPAKLTYLRVDQFRHVRPGTTLNFGQQLNAFVGPNGSGKTTALALISAIIRNNFHPFIQENFRLGFGLVDQEFELDGTLVNVVAQGREDRNGTTKLTFSGELRHGDRVVRVESNASESIFTLRGTKFPGRSVIPGQDAESRPFELIHAVRFALPESEEFSAMRDGRPGIAFDMLSSLNNHTCTRISEGTETFLDLFMHGGDFQDRNPTLGMVFITGDELRKAKLDPLARGEHLPDSFLLPQLRPQENITDIVTIDSKAPPLSQFIELSQYSDARLILTKTAASKFKGFVRQVFANPLARFTTLGGNEISHHQLSFGEKRLLTFLIKLYAYESNIVVDELANGMHHSWIERAMELLDELGTQAFLSSQNPLLLDCLPLTRENHGELHQLVVCELTDSGEMIWRNLSEIEATDFFKSLEVGLQHVSEIMRTKGMW